MNSHRDDNSAEEFLEYFEKISDIKIEPSVLAV